MLDGEMKASSLGDDLVVPLPTDPFKIDLSSSMPRSKQSRQDVMPVRWSFPQFALRDHVHVDQFPLIQQHRANPCALDPFAETTEIVLELLDQLRIPGVRSTLLVPVEK